ncbi:hypothetical protein [Qipengyuania xiapuensis]|nr:hypothetical protein [Qipengyuania xiapuensis]
MPLVLNNDEFLGFLELAHPVEGESFKSGISELRDVLRAVKSRGDAPRWCEAERRISGGPADIYEFEALSPSDKQISVFLSAIPDWVEKQAAGARLSGSYRNDTSVASVISLSGAMLLMGADLENKSGGKGWPEVHEGSWKSRGQAEFFKLPHHGSATGHYGPVWNDMLIDDVFSALAPFNKGKKLPSSADLNRIANLTSNAYATSLPESRKKLKRPALVESIIHQKGVELLAEWTDLGQLRFRRPKAAVGQAWEVELFGSAPFKIESAAA